MLFGLSANLKKNGSKDAIEDFLSWVTERSEHQLFLVSDLKELIGDKANYLAPDEIASKVDMMVSMGGDGSLLHTARLVGSSEIPILGINLGTFGFLTQHRPKHLRKALEAIVKGEHKIENRMVLEVDSGGQFEIENKFALNDIIIDNSPISRLINIALNINDENVVTYRADGLVIATPTGSTAYSLAVGGPIMHPRMEAIIASPISSFSLSSRPMIFDGSAELEIKISSEQDQGSMSIDGQKMYSLNNKSVIKIKKANHYINLVTFPENSYYKALKNKLHWGYTPNGDEE